MKLRHIGLCMTLLGAVALSACGDDTGGTDAEPKDGTVTDGGTDGGPADTGTDGGGPVDTGTDGGGPVDTGVDAGPVDTGVMPNQPEGANCAFDPNDMTGMSNCAAGLQCVPWNANNVGASNPAIATCARVGCTADTDCTGAGFGECVEGFVYQLDDMNRILIINYCASNAAVAAGGDCSASTRVTTNIDGCQDGSSCFLGFGFIPDADTGKCGENCQWTANDEQGACPQDRPYCNPLFGDTTTATVPVDGICSLRPVGLGDVCDGEDPTNDCDAQEPGALICIGGPSNDFCLELCDTTDGQCPSTDAIGASTPTSCNPFDPNDPTNTLGLCSVNCTDLPDSCVSDFGDSVCSALQFQTGGNFAICNEVLPPYIDKESVTFNNQGQIDPSFSPQNNCAAANADNCEPGSTCIAINAAQTEGACAVFCLVGTSTTPDQGCEVFNDNGVTCINPINGLDPMFGICGSQL